MTERRQPGARVPFEALVEIAAPEGTSFEAESVDLSTTGMHLRTAYLPKVGTSLNFRFEPTDGSPSREAVVVAGEVVWSQDGDGGCEFGVRFADVAGREADAIQRIVSITNESSSALAPGSAVRIHIEGMNAPMKATLRGDFERGAVVGSELRMLRLGAVVELEDKEKRTRRPARVDGVECEIDPGTRVPQLVVKLRYAEGDADRELPYLPTKKVPMPADVENAARHATMTPPPPPSEASKSMPPAEVATTQQRVSLPVADEPEGRIDTMKHGMRAIGDKMKDAFGGAAAAASKFGARVGTTVSLLSKKKSGHEDEGDDGDARRTTSAFAGFGSKPRTLRPQGASRDFADNSGGRDEEGAMQEIDTKKVARRRQMGIAAGVGVAVILGFLAFRKPTPPQPIVQAPAPELAPASAPVATPVAPPVETVANIASPAPALIGDSTGLDAKGNPNPFGTTTVKKGTKMVLRLDGPVTEIKGMQMPNGFVVSVPNRKSLEAAGPLAAKDKRISSAKVVNQPGGAELTIAFEDGASSPPYIVKAKGDSLEIVLGHEKAIAKKKNKGGAHPAKAPKHK
jgi:hypothetical protein